MLTPASSPAAQPCPARASPPLASREPDSPRAWLCLNFKTVSSSSGGLTHLKAGLCSHCGGAGWVKKWTGPTADHCWRVPSMAKSACRNPAVWPLPLLRSLLWLLLVKWKSSCMGILCGRGCLSPPASPPHPTSSPAGGAGCCWRGAGAARAIRGAARSPRVVAGEVLSLLQQWYTSSMNVVCTWLTDRMDLQLHIYQLKTLIRIVKVIA